MPVPSSRRCLLAAALLLGGAGAAAFPGAGPGPSTPKPRQGPALVSTVPMALPAAVSRLLDAAGVPPTSLGFHARRVDARQPFASLNAEQPFVMASTAKLVTSMAALDLLGANHQWRTYAFTKGELVQGRLQGDLLIVGGGNAMLRSDALRRWFQQLRAQGLNEVTGNIVLDRYAFALTPADHARTPSPEPDRPHHALPDALMLDEGLLRVEVSPAPRGKASIRLEPPLAGVQIVNAVARGSGCFTQAAFMPAAFRGGVLQLQVKGMATPECGVQRLQFAPLPHAEFTTRAIGALWAETGGTLGGTVVDRESAEGSAVLQRDAVGGYQLPFSTHGSEPLPLVLREVNKTSNNMLARNLMLSLAPGFPLQPATLDAAQLRVREWLRGQGVPAGEIEVDTGSGLSRAERATPRALVDLLVRAWNGPNARWLVDSLPIAGVDGTLAGRMRDGPAAGKAFLKTGTLLDARGLAGFVQARSGKVYAVTALINHPEATHAAPALDALIEWLAENG